MPGAGNNPHIYTTQRIKQITDTQAVTTSKEGPKADTTITVPASTQELIGVKSVSISTFADSSGYTSIEIDTLDTTSYSDRLFVRFRNKSKNSITGVSISAYLRRINVTGFPVKRLFGSNGGIKIRDMVDRSSIARNGENAIEIQNQWINSQAQCEDVADHIWKINRKKHLFAITFDGIRPWYEVGTRYDMTVEYSLETGDIINIDSVCQVISCEYERSVDSYGQTVVVFKEIDQSWQKTIQQSANYIGSGFIEPSYALDKAMFQLTLSMSDSLGEAYARTVSNLSSYSLMHYSQYDEYLFQTAAATVGTYYTSNLVDIAGASVDSTQIIEFNGSLYQQTAVGLYRSDTTAASSSLVTAQSFTSSTKTGLSSFTAQCVIQVNGSRAYVFGSSSYLDYNSGTVTQSSTPISGSFATAAHGETNSIAMATNGNYIRVDSSGTMTTGSLTNPGSAYSYKIVYGNGRYVAIGSSSSGAYIAVSTDNGSTWAYNSESINGTSAWVVFGNGIFIYSLWDLDGLSGDWTLTNYASSDGDTWTIVSTDSGNIGFISSSTPAGIAFGNGVFIRSKVVTDGVTYDTIFYSSVDGVVWVNEYTDTGFEGYELTFIGGLFFVHGSGYTGDYDVKISTDGNTWTSIGFSTSKAIGDNSFIAFPESDVAYQLKYSAGDAVTAIFSSADALYLLTSSTVSTIKLGVQSIAYRGLTPPTDTWTTHADDDGMLYGTTYRYDPATNTSTALGLSGSPWYCGDSGGRPHYYSTSAQTVQKVEADYTITTLDLQLPTETIEVRVSDAGTIYTTNESGTYSVYIKLAGGAAYRVFRQALPSPPLIYLGKRAMVAYVETGATSTLKVAYSQEV